MDFFQEGNELGGGGDFFLVDQDEHLLQFDGHFIGVGDEVGGEISAVELHAFDHVDVGFQALAFLDGDDAVLADALEGVGHDAADLAVVVGGDGGDVGDVGLAADRVWIVF